MPGGDRTGPRGLGPQTGRRAGFCAGYDQPGFMNPVPGRGAGFGAGRGARGGPGRRIGRASGWGWRGYALTETPGLQEQHASGREILDQRLEQIEAELAEVRRLIHGIPSSEAGGRTE